MSKKLASLKRLSGTAVVAKKGTANQTIHFSLAKPNRFEIKGGGLDCRFDGTRRFALKEGKWIPAGKDSTLPATLSCLSPFFGKAYPSSGFASVPGIKGQGYKVASGQIVFINAAIQMPGKHVVFEKSGARSLVSFKVLNFARPKVVAAVATANTKAQPIVAAGKPSQPSIPISVSESTKNLKDVGLTDPLPDTLGSVGRVKPSDPVRKGGDANTMVSAEVVSADPTVLGTRLPKVGDVFSNFVAPTPDGDNVDLASLSKKVKGVLLVFWNRDCPASAEFLPMVLNQRQTLRERKIALIGVNCGDQPKDVKAYMKANSLDFLTVTPAENLQARYGILAFPTTIALDNSGKVLGTFVGSDVEGLRALLPAFGL
ncbi:MAG: TlpA disulfide reductase family protein [Fimbriimonadaceae bacterium]